MHGICLSIYQLARFISLSLSVSVRRFLAWSLCSPVRSTRASISVSVSLYLCLPVSVSWVCHRLSSILRRDIRLSIPEAAAMSSISVSVDLGTSLPTSVCDYPSVEDCILQVPTCGRNWGSNLHVCLLFALCLFQACLFCTLCNPVRGTRAWLCVSVCLSLTLSLSGALVSRLSMSVWICLSEASRVNL